MKKNLNSGMSFASSRSVSSVYDPNTPICCIETFEDDFGTYIWPSALFMLDWLAQNKHLVAHKTVIELGCGIGIPAIYAALVGAQKVFLVDSERNLTLVEAQMRLNPAVLSTVQAAAFDWNDCDACERLKSLLQKPTATSIDIILGSDLFYHKKDFGSVLALLCSLLHANPNAVCYIAYHERNLNYTINPYIKMFEMGCELVCHKEDLYLLRLFIKKASSAIN